MQIPRAGPAHAELREKSSLPYGRDLAREGFTVTVAQTQAAQARTYLDDLYAFRADPLGVGDLPVTVVSGGAPVTG